VDDLLTTLKDCTTRLDDYRRHYTRLGEENTKAALIEPVLRSLGSQAQSISTCSKPATSFPSSTL